MTPRTATDVDERIREATMAVLRDHGYSALSMEGVASDAGVAKTTIYRRHRNRADLATAALGSHAATMPDADAGLSTREALVEFLESFAVRFEAVGLDVLGSMLVDRDDRELLELHRERVVRPRAARATELLRRGQERGEVRADANPELVLEMLVGSFFSRHIIGREMDPADWAEQVVATVWRGLAP